MLYKKAIFFFPNIVVFLFLFAPAVNYNLYHYVLDWNIAKIVGGLTFLYFSILTIKDLKILHKIPKEFIVFLCMWFCYLVLNSIMGLSVKTNIKILFRLIFMWGVAFQLFLIWKTKKHLFIHLNSIINSIILCIFILIIFEWLRVHSFLLAQAHLANFITSYRQGAPRLNALFISPNELGFYINSLFLIKLYLFQKKVFKLNILEALVWIISSVIIFKTHSRNSELSFFFISITFFFFLFINKVSIKKYKLLLIRKKLLIVIFFLLFSGSFTYFISIKKEAYENKLLSLITEVENIVNNYDPLIKYKPYTSNEVRLIIIKHAIKAFIKKPMIGIGLYSFPDYFKTPLKKGVFHTHNLILEIITGQGIVGLLFVLVFCFLVKFYTLNFISLLVLLLFNLTNLFDNLMWSYSFYHTLAILLGIILYDISVKSDANLSK